MVHTVEELRNLQRRCVEAKIEWEAEPPGSMERKQKYSTMVDVIKEYNEAVTDYHQATNTNLKPSPTHRKSLI
jgi:hypothetical protein